MIRSLFRASATFALVTGLLGASLVLPGCGDDKGWAAVKKESGEVWAAAKAWGVAKRDAAEAFFSRSIDALPGRLADAKAKAVAAGGDAASTLDAKWGDVTRKLAEMKVAAGDKWEGARDAFVKAYESLEHDLSR